MVRQPAIVGEFWFNTEPLKPEDLAGKVVLVDFWTYSCVNCLQTLPYLKRWWERYREGSFVLIGIHTPEFEFEKDPKNVERAIRGLGVTWPVVLDNAYVNWNAFANRYWPAKYLVDPKGRIVYSHFGEGAYAETEREIQRLLRERDPAVVLPPITADEHSHGGVCFVPTPETYCGYLRGRLANAGGYQQDRVAEYRAPEGIPDDSIALDGKFLARPEYVESAGPEAALLLRFRATEVNVVLRPSSAKASDGEPVGASAIVEVTLEGKPLPAEIRGREVSGSGEANVKNPALYNLLKSKMPVEGTLAVRAKRGNSQAYAFTFSGCTG